MSDLELALFFHMLGVLLFVSGVVVAGVAFEAARRRERPAEISLLLGLTRIGVLLVVAGGLVLFGFGMWLVDLAGFDFGAGWISASMALFIIALVLGGAGGQRPKQARLLATKLAQEGSPASPELRELLDDRRSLAVNYLSAVIVLAILALMVFKP
ncbi:MAG: DUF2269 family protein [Solirubrobacterales bacterium]